MAQEKDDSIKLRLSFFDPFQANVPFLYPPPPENVRKPLFF